MNLILSYLCFNERATQNELYDVISGKSQVRNGAVIQSISSYLSKSSQSGSKIEKTKHFKEQEAENLRAYILENNLWISTIDLTQ